jgi:hypothetical protein
MEEWRLSAAEATDSIERILKRHRGETATAPTVNALPASCGSFDKCAHFIRKLDEFLQTQSVEARSYNAVLRLCGDFRAVVFVLVSLSRQFVDASAVIASNGAPGSTLTAREELMQHRFSSLLHKLLEHTKNVVLAELRLDGPFTSWSVLSPADSKGSRIAAGGKVSEFFKSEDVRCELPVGLAEHAQGYQWLAACDGEWVSDNSFDSPFEMRSPFHGIFDIEPDLFELENGWGENDQLFAERQDYECMTI